MQKIPFLKFVAGRALRALVLCLVLSGLATGAWAYHFAATNQYGTTIYYNVITVYDDADTDEVVGEVEVTYGDNSSTTANEEYYQGDVVVPEEVYWEGDEIYFDGVWKVVPGGTYKVTRVGASAFYNCKQLTAVTIGANVRSLGSASSGSASSFFNCTSLSSVTFADAKALTFIGFQTFASCSSLESIDIPEGVDTLSEGALNGCSSLTRVTLPSTLTRMEDLVFGECSSLYSITIPSSVNYMGYEEFLNCTKLKRVVMLGETPPDIDYSGKTKMFEGDTQKVNIYVPSAALSTYNAGDWKNLTNTTLVAYDAAIEQTLAITDENGTAFSTIYDGESDILLPATLTAYIVTDVDSDGELTLSALSDNTIPAATAALVAGELGDYADLIEVAPTASTAVESNMLYGSDSETVTTVGDNGNNDDYYFYKLTTNAAGDTSTAGFYWGASDGSAFEMPGGKAWLAVNRQVFVDGVKGLKMKLPDESTTDGITTVSVSPAPRQEGIYTLQGVRVTDTTQRGVYIVNGRKVLIK